jgi:hypothetical protein
MPELGASDGGGKLWHGVWREDYEYCVESDVAEWDLK